ncbi:coiled-coil domain-containing protein 112-like [Actinia tenebrosa]|uniref:Coiled-coil domain-containing protein 112-like n=1 Tax=Actinia tenebrosa TaxID=6105 RepID=A0A6P8ICJ4_ACTTE|nr:coiled-coil domain-containing protein 112-like [Actinia tenebrosa]
MATYKKKNVDEHKNKVAVQENPTEKQGKHGRPKTENRKRNEFFEQVDSLNREYNSLEKERNTLMFSRRSDFRKEYCSFEDSDVKSLNEKTAEKQHLKQQLGKIRGSVSKFQRELLDVKPSPSFVQKLKDMMEEIESSIMAFKEQQQKIYDGLIQEEKSTQQEITAMEKKFDSWCQLPAPSTVAANVKRTTSTVTASLPPAVAAFEKFLVQTGGHQGGWDDYDNQLFLKLKAKYKNNETFLRMAGSAIPGKNFDEVRQHNEWFIQYLELKESKRKAILEWKQNKKEEKDDSFMKTEETEEDDQIKKKNEKLENERAERLSKLAEYKAQKELEKAKLQEQQFQEEMNKMKEREKEEKKRLELKAQVEEYARCRAEEEKVMREAEEARKAQLRKESKPSTEEINRIRERNTKILKEKQAVIKAKEEEIKEKERRLRKLKSQVEVKAERDPSRLYKLTRGLEERRKESKDGSGAKGPMLHMPHRY